MEYSNSDFVPVAGFEGLYVVNRAGQVISLHKRNYGKFMTPTLRRGYYTVQLSNGFGTNTLFLHRIVAAAFIPKPEGRDYVNHKNGNKLDNQIQNLEWVSHSENMKHAFRTGLMVPVGQKRPVINTCTGETFESVGHAAEYYSMNKKTLTSGVLQNPFSLHCLKYGNDLGEVVVDIS